MLYNIKSMAELAADVILEKGNDTYVCSFDPTKVDRSANAPAIEAQPVWQITCYRNSVMLDSEEEITRTQALYPNGSQQYHFKVTEVFDYNYTYRL